MGRKLPVCAGCGKPLARCSKMVLEFPGIPGVPAVGWHFDCNARDRQRGDLVPLFADAAVTFRDTRAALLVIEARGADRVSAGPAWAKAKQEP